MISVEQFNYKLPFKWYSGGVIAFTLEQYEKINGMSNVYFGWGKEDDDLHRRLTTSCRYFFLPRYRSVLHRIVSSGYRIDRQDPQAGSECVGMYASLDHGPRDYSSTKRNNELLNGRYSALDSIRRGNPFRLIVYSTAEKDNRMMGSIVLGIEN